VSDYHDITFIAVHWLRGYVFFMHTSSEYGQNVIKSHRFPLPPCALALAPTLPPQVQIPGAAHAMWQGNCSAIELVRTQRYSRNSVGMINNVNNNS